MMAQSETLNSSQIIFITLFFLHVHNFAVHFTSHCKLCNYAEPKPRVSWTLQGERLFNFYLFIYLFIYYYYYYYYFIKKFAALAPLSKMS